MTSRIIGIISSKLQDRIMVARMIIRARMANGQLVLPLLEVPLGMEARHHMTIENRALTYLVFQKRKIMRDLVIIWSAELTSQIDRRLRALTDEIWLVEKKDSSVWKIDTGTGKAERIELPHRKTKDVVHRK